MIAPLPLRYGDKIGIIAPSRKIGSDDLSEFEKMIHQWGYQLVYGKNLFDEYHQFAGSDEDRAADFIRMISDPEIKAIFCARGGYGTVRILERLDKELIRKNPKWIIGYSDITVLHSFYNKVVECETIHAAMPVHFTKDSATNISWIKLERLLSGDSLRYDLVTHELNRFGYSEGILVGGNLSVLYSLHGTFCDLDTEGKILFIEDLDEYLYHIDRMMMNLKISGKLKKLKGLIVGGMTGMKDNTVPFGRSAYDIIAEAVEDYSYPVVFDFPAGHREPNYPLILGRDVILEVQEEASVIKFTDFQLFN
jgi:muramoyltetrapeptide carboxypeptidase